MSGGFITKNILAIDIGGSKIIAGVVTENGEILNTSSRNLSRGTDFNKLHGIILSCANEAARDIRVDSAGVAIPGLADVKRGVWVYSPFSNIADIPIADLLTGELGVPVFIENDVNACAVAEMRFGACKLISDFLWITVSNGVGGAIVMDGGLRAGHSGNAGEIGHMIVEEDPSRALSCGCGGMGCLEAMAAGPGISKRYGADGVGADEISRRAREGEAHALDVMRETGVYLGRAAAACVTLLNPGYIVIGGGVAGAMDIFAPFMEREIRERSFCRANRDFKLIPTALGYNAALLGAAVLPIVRG